MPWPIVSRLFYLEEVEEIRLADANVYAGRRLHDQLDKDPCGDRKPQIHSIIRSVTSVMRALPPRSAVSTPAAVTVSMAVIRSAAA